MTWRWGSSYGILKYACNMLEDIEYVYTFIINMILSCLLHLTRNAGTVLSSFLISFLPSFPSFLPFPSFPFLPSFFSFLHSFTSFLPSVLFLPFLPFISFISSFLSFLSSFPSILLSFSFLSLALFLSILRCIPSFLPLHFLFVFLPQLTIVIQIRHGILQIFLIEGFSKVGTYLTQVSTTASPLICSFGSYSKCNVGVHDFK